MKTPSGISTLARDGIFQELPQQKFDVLVIGGGIMGAGIALDAASRGLNVLLAEKQDFAAGTSSRSTKLIHGGLRYLKNLEFKLVRHVASERKILHRNAPHLVIPEPMLIPILENTSYGYWTTKIGLTIYDFLGNVDPPEQHRMLRKKQTLEKEPLLNPEKLKGAGYFTEYRTDDGRLTMEVLKTAHNFGATCLNYSEVTGFLNDDNGKLNGATLHDNLTGKSYNVKAKCVINATGPWSAQLMQQAKAENLPALVHTKGVHLVVPFHKLPLKQSVYFDIPGGRMLFAIPRNEVTYLGTTDTPFTGNLENPEVSREDAEYILEQINIMFPEKKLGINDIVSSWAGVRVLLFEAGKKPSEISRKDEIFVSENGLITVAGGKLTGYRKLAEQVVNKAVKLHFPENKNVSETQNIKLSGGNFENAGEVKSYIENYLQTAHIEQYPKKTITYLVQIYGCNTDEILKEAARLKAENQKPEIRLLKAEIWYTINFEGATNISDFLIRRTAKLNFDRNNIESILPEVLDTFKETLHWNEQKLEKEKAAFKTYFDAAVKFKFQ